jgi:hypothetical protein
MEGFASLFSKDIDLYVKCSINFNAIYGDHNSKSKYKLSRVKGSTDSQQKRKLDQENHVGMIGLRVEI